MEPMTFLGQAIEVNMARFIIAQVIGLGVLAFDFWSFQTEDQLTYFKRTLMSSSLWVVMYFFVGAQLPIILITSASVLRNAVFTWALIQNTGRARMIARRTMYGSLIAVAILAGPTIAGAQPGTRILQAVLALFTIGFVVGQYMPGIWMLRISAITYAMAIILVNSPLDTFNPVGIIIEVNKILAIVIFFVAYFKRQKEKARLAALTPTALSLGKDLRQPELGLAA